MNLQGVYTVFLKDRQLKSKNAIQQDGFNLVRNWFVNRNNKNIKKIDLNNSDTKITFNNITSDSLTSSLYDSIFYQYEDNKYISNSSNSAYIQIDFNYTKNITSIGIDAIVTNYPNYNSNITVYIDQIGNNNYNLVQDFFISVPYKDINYYHKQNYGKKQNIFYFCDNDGNFSSKQVKSIRIYLNQLTTNKLNYRVYSLNLYENSDKYLPPERITLYDVDGNVLINKQIENSFSYSNDNSIVYKVVLQLDELNNTDYVHSISSDFYDYNESQWKKFSYSQFETAWNQQEFQTIELQYKLSFSNQYINTVNEN